MTPVTCIFDWFEGFETNLDRKPCRSFGAVTQILLRAPGAVIKFSSRENEKCAANPSSAAQSGSVGNWGSLEPAEYSR